MRHLLYIALFLLYCTCGCFAAVVQQLPQKGKSALQTYTVSTDIKTDEADGKSGNEWQPIRIGVYTKYVELAVKYCETVKKKGEIEQVQEEFENEFGYELLETIDEVFGDLCTDKDNKMTEAKKNILFRDVLPKAIKLHTDRLKVNSVKESPKISSDGKILDGECSEFNNPWNQKFKDTADVDFMIFTSLSEQYKKVEICTQNSDKRPTSAVITFIPDEIIATRHYIRLTAREIAKGLGFEYNVMKGLNMIDTGNRRNPYLVNSSKTLEMLEKHYNCPRNEVKGLYLENEGVDYRTPSHWERRIAKDELMSTYSVDMGVSGMYYTALTLAVFHSMPYYSADFNMAEPMSWGNKSGCDFFEGKITNSADPKYSNMFCKEGNKKILQCTSDRFALGMCLTKKKPIVLPDGYLYFTGERNDLGDDFMDDYPIIRPLKGTVCEDGLESLMPGSLPGSDSRCLKGEGLQLKHSSDRSFTIGGVCARVKCDNNKVSVLLKRYKEEEKEMWRDCTEGEKIDVTGTTFSNGSIVCPRRSEVCDGLSKVTSSTIRFYDGEQVSDTYKVVLSGAKKEVKKEEKRNQLHAQSEVVRQEPGGDTVSQPLPEKDGLEEPKGKEKNNGHSSSVVKEHADLRSSVPGTPTSGSHSRGSDNNHLQSSVQQSPQQATVVSSGSSNEREKDVKSSQESKSPAPVVQSAQSLPPASAPAAAAAAATHSPVILNTNTDKTLKGQEEHLPSTVEGSVDSVSGVAGTSAIASQSTGSLGENGARVETTVKPSEVSQPNVPPPKPSEEHVSNANQTPQTKVQPPNELESHTADKVETEVSSPTSSSINVPPTAASPLPEVSSIPTNVPPTVETTQPNKNETTNNTSPSTTSSSTDVHERNNASITAKEPITEDKNKDSTANQVEDLANQLVTIGEKNADSSITISYVGGCLMALLCVLLVL